MLRRLPSPGVPIGRLAAECCGDAHALDDGRPVGTLALSAVRALAGLPFAAEGTADSRRAAWAAVGVHLDDLSSLVLCLGLPGDTRTPLGRRWRRAARRDSRRVLTLRQLRCHTEPLNTGPLNTGPLNPGPGPAPLGYGSARTRWWSRPPPTNWAPRCQPLVCVGGQPSAAGWRLLELLAAGGAEFGYHGDFDWGGVRIARAVHDRVNWRPWRYDRQAYEAAASAAHPLTPLAGLAGEPAATPWDPELAAAMRHRNVRIEEELTLDALLQDLSPG